MLPDGSARPTLITTTKEAYDALVEAQPLVANPAWQVALDAVVRALLDPAPDKLEAGRIAFEELHRSSRSAHQRERKPRS